MPARRRGRSSARRQYKLQKYSNETNANSVTINVPANTATNATFTIVPPSNVYGTRKVKNFTLTLKAEPTTNVALTAYWVLVFVPGGQTPGNINIATTTGGNTVTSYYDPNQHVIASGVIDNKQVYRYKTRLARNLQSNDYIALVLRPLQASAAYSVIASISTNYAIAF